MLTRTFVTTLGVLVASVSFAIAQEAKPSEIAEPTDCTEAEADTSAELGKSLAAILRDGNNAAPKETACAENVTQAARRTATVLGTEGLYWAKKGGNAFMGWIKTLEEKQEDREDAE